MSEDPFVRQAAVLRLTNTMIGAVNSLDVDVVEANDAVVAAGLSAAAALQSEQDAGTSAGQASSSATNAATSATGAETARDTAQALAAITIVGAGRPDIPATLTGPIATAVAAAGVATKFRSTDGPQGAWVWMRRGAGWVCIEGETEWRNVSSSALRTTSAVMILIRRSGRMINLSFDAYTLIDPTIFSDFLAPIPAGFRPGKTVRTSAYEVGPVYVTTGGSSAVACFAAQPAGARLRFYISWLNSEQWPTTLPGTAG